MEMVNRGGFRLATFVSGRSDGPWIVLSNSLGASQVMWRPQMPLFERHYRVLAYDARGHGDSEAPQGPYSMADLVGDVLALMDHYGIDKADVAGLSMGGMTGLGLALDHRDRLNRLICCDARADATPAFIQSWDQRIAAVEAGGMQAVLEGTMQRWFTQPFRERETAVMAEMRAMVLKTSVAGYVGCARALQGLDYLKRLGDITTPTLYVVGAQDEGTPPDVMRAMAEATPGARYVELPDAAHIANVNNPQAFNNAIGDFLGLH